MAAGPLDGIYQVGSGEHWLTVHQTGNHVIVGQFFKSTGSHSVTLANGQRYNTNAAGRWYLLAGDLVPNSTSLTITGESNLGACTSTYRIDFGAPQLWMQWTGPITTPEGSVQSIDCASDYQTDTANGTWYKLTKIF
jgi:hypothetical protein